MKVYFLELYTYILTEALLLCSFIEITLRHGCSPVNLSIFFKENLWTVASVLSKQHSKQLPYSKYFEEETTFFDG